MERAKLSRPLHIAVVVAAVVAMSVTVMRGTDAALTATYTNDGNSLSVNESVTVNMAGDAGTTALFPSVTMDVGDIYSECVVIEHIDTGSPTPGEVTIRTINDAKESAQATTGSKDLGLKIERGDGGAFGDCTGFVATQTVIDGSVWDFNDAREVPTGWTPSGNGDTESFRITFDATNPASGNDSIDPDYPFIWKVEVS